MRKNWLRLIATLFVLALLGALAWRSTIERESSFEGKPFSEWLRESIDPGLYDASLANKSEGAIRKIGTNGLPTLLRLVSKTDSPLKARIIRSLPRAWADQHRIREAGYHHILALKGFATLGTNAAPAVPDLVALLAHPEWRVRGNVLSVLGSIGTPARAAIPAIKLMLADSNKNVAILAVQTLGGLKADPSFVLPLLLKQAADSARDRGTRHIAIDLIGAYGADASNAIPVLQAVLKDQQSIWLHGAANFALRSIAPAEKNLPSKTSDGVTN
ncbi:MAG TPA: HEAT repeat domain-containing protein [Verrucomicrobiae bacterium]|nr:HEAT repeat domain-containing protein [Verrucomicrobiae bacterium]